MFFLVDNLVKHIRIKKKNEKRAIFFFNLLVFEDIKKRFFSKE